MFFGHSLAAILDRTTIMAPGRKCPDCPLTRPQPVDVGRLRRNSPPHAVAQPSVERHWHRLVKLDIACFRIHWCGGGDLWLPRLHAEAIQLFSIDSKDALISDKRVYRACELLPSTP